MSGSLPKDTQLEGRLGLNLDSLCPMMVVKKQLLLVLKVIGKEDPPPASGNGPPHLEVKGQGSHCGGRASGQPNKAEN